MPSFVRALSGCLLVTASFACHAETLWLCTLADDAVRLVCVADVDPLQANAAAPTPTVQVRGTTFPLDPRRLYTVDLWSPPTDWADVEQLAQATICYRTAGCTALVAAPPAAFRSGQTLKRDR